jgi:inhibitor of KinA
MKEGRSRVAGPPVPKIRISGDSLLLVEYGDAIDPAVNEKVRSIAELLRKVSPPGVRSILPSYRSLGLVYDPMETDENRLRDLLRKMESELPSADIPSPRLVEIPVIYGGAFGPDLEYVAARNGLGVEEVISIHTAQPYPIYTIGFAPGFCYLGGLDPRLHTPRLETPRTVVPAGSVGIAEAQTGVYPLESPGGWRLIGRTPLRLFDPERSDPFLYKAGDNVSFVPISVEDYRRLEKEGA